MNITAATKTTDRSQERAEGVCWSSEWTFIEEVDGASQNPDRPALVVKEDVDSVFRYPSLPRRF